jgi:hypothetical protein
MADGRDGGSGYDSAFHRDEHFEYFGRPCRDGAFFEYLGGVATGLRQQLPGAEVAVLTPGISYADRGDVERAGQDSMRTAWLGMREADGFHGRTWEHQRAIAPVALALKERFDFHVAVAVREEEARVRAGRPPQRDPGGLLRAEQTKTLTLGPGWWARYRRVTPGEPDRRVHQLCFELDRRDPFVQNNITTEAETVAGYIDVRDERSSQHRRGPRKWSIDKIAVIEVSWPMGSGLPIPALNKMPSPEALGVPESGISVKFGSVDMVTSYRPKP